MDACIGLTQVVTVLQHHWRHFIGTDMAPPHPASLPVFLRARFSSEGYLGLHLTLGVVALMVCAFIFGDIAEDVMTANTITVLDVQVSQWFHAHATPWLTRFMLLVTHLHNTVGILGLSLLLGIYWARTRAWDWLLTLVLTVPVGMLLNVLLKNIFQRARPSFDGPLATLSTYSFPSGHAASATLFYGLLAAWYFCQARSWRGRVAAVALATLAVALVGLSRVYLGAHYPSDVLAGMAASSGWLAFSLTAVGTSRRRRRWQQMKG